MPHFMKILFPLDSTGESESALPCVERLARRWGSEIVLVQVTEPFVGMQPQYWQPLEEQALSTSREYLESVQNRLTGLQVKTLSLIGSPPTALVEAAQDEGCELIVMISHGRSGLTRWLVGSISESVLRQSTVPLLLLHPPGPQVGEFHRVLVPLDGSEPSLQVLSRITPFLAANAQVTLLRCTDFSAQQQLHMAKDSSMEQVMEQLQQELDAVEVPWANVERKLVKAAASEGILRCAQEIDSDLIAMSTHGRSGFRRFWLGSVTEKVARSSPCPVLAFPGKALE